MAEFVRLWWRVLVVGLLAISATTRADDLAITHLTLYPAPGAHRVDDATVLIRDGRVAEVGPALPTGDLPVLDAEGRVGVAGLWNSHVHFMDPALAEDPAPILRDMLLRYGFTNVVDTGSVLADTQALAAAIEDARIPGPRIVTASGGLVYTDGTPSYLPGVQLPEIATPPEAALAVNGLLDAGADGIKIFSGSFISPTETVLLPPQVIHAVTAAAHARGSFVVAHPNNRDGLVNAVQNGVDVLAHTAPSAGALGAELVDAMRSAGVALVPTLKLWSWELTRAGVPEPDTAAFQYAGVTQLRDYFRAGGEILFGTDVGYMRDYDTREEFELMARAGLEFDDILASLTVNAARRFAGETGRVEPGAPGDVVIFVNDPSRDAAAWSRVSHTVRGGRIIYAAEL